MRVKFESVTLMFLLLLAPAVIAQTTPAVREFPAAQSTIETGLTPDEIIDRFIDREKVLVQRLKGFRPMVETYVQNLDLDDELGAVPKSDRYFLGKLDLTAGINQKSLTEQPGWASKVFGKVTQLWSVKYLPNGFAQMILIDSAYFDRQHYDFEYVRREFIGEVRCYVYDVQPKEDKGTKATFWGRIWVEDRDFNVVRFNGTYGPNVGADLYFHFDSWRENLKDNLWLPAYIYTEESDMKYFLGQRKLRFKGQTRLWGYNVDRPNSNDEFTTLKVEQVEDNVEGAEGMSPVIAFRAWERYAEDNVLKRIQKAGLLAPPGEVDKILQTVITNLEVTNNLVIEPSVRARVLLTSPLESLTVGRTIVLSRGLIDVLPDEASLAMVLAHELAHIALGHRLDTKYAFNDRMLFEDEETFKRLFVRRDQQEEIDADKKAAELLANSPYKEKLANAGLFLRALDERAPALRHLLKPHMGNFMAKDSKVRRMADLLKIAPRLENTNIEQIAALPLGGRIRLNPWNNQIEFVKAKPVALQHAREKLPFEVTPVQLYLTRQQASADVAAQKN